MYFIYKSIRNNFKACFLNVVSILKHGVKTAYNRHYIFAKIIILDQIYQSREEESQGQKEHSKMIITRKPSVTVL